MQQLDLEYPCRWVAYFDLLGFKNMVRRLPVIWDVLRCYREALDQIKNRASLTPTRWFSDTFLFYTQDDSRDSFGRIAGASESFFRWMLRKWIPLRGCLTVGGFYVGEEDVLFGPAMIDAYEEAEGQNWLGLILTREAENRIKQYEVNGRTVYDVLQEHYFRHHDVPFERYDPQQRQWLPTNEDCRRLVFTMNPYSLRHGNNDLEEAKLLWKDLDHMQHAAAWDLSEKEREEQMERIDRKYRNTKDFLLDTVPELSNYVKGDDGT